MPIFNMRLSMLTDLLISAPGASLTARPAESEATGTEINRLIEQTIYFLVK
jgi:hypothetical protein